MYKKLDPFIIYKNPLHKYTIGLSIQLMIDILGCF